MYGTAPVIEKYQIYLLKSHMKIEKAILQKGIFF